MAQEAKVATLILSALFHGEQIPTLPTNSINGLMSFYPICIAS